LRAAYDQKRVATGHTRAKMTLQEGQRSWDRVAIILAKQATPRTRLQRVTFESPADLAGSSVLTHDDFQAEVAQWVYVPAYHTVRRIPPANRGEMYLGTDYAYEDLLELRWDAYSFRTVPGDPGGKVKLIGVEVSPAGNSSATSYSRRVFWIEPARRVIVREDYFDKQGKLRKRLTNSQLRQYGKYWLWDRSVMEDLISGHKTVTQIVERQVDGNVADDLFTVNALKRAGTL
jgi:hypothetical protein